MRFLLVAALCAALLFACQARDLAQADSPAAAPELPTAACEEAPADSIALPSNAYEVVALEATGTRNFTCVDGEVDKSYMIANITDGVHEGMVYYDEKGDVIVDLVDTENGEAGRVTLTTADVVKEDSPVPGQLSLARWTAIENSGSLDATVAYMTRTNTTGVEPACEAGWTTPEGEYEQTPFSSVYTLYSCDP